MDAINFDELSKALESITGGNVDYMEIVEIILSLIESIVAKLIGG